MEMHKGIPMFECLKEKQPVESFTKLVQCTNLNHKPYSAEYVKYEDGNYA